MRFNDGMGLPGDTTLLLRVYAEHRWLAEELLDVVQRVESQTWTLAAPRTGEELAVAREQLRSMWGEGQRRAAHTDRAFESLTAGTPGGGSWLVHQTCSYYRWLRNLRASLAARIEPHLITDSRAAGRASAA